MARQPRPTGEEAAKYMSADEALKKAHDMGIKITHATLLNWLVKHKLGFQPGGNNSTWYVDIEKFNNHIQGGQQDGENVAA